MQEGVKASKVEKPGKCKGMLKRAHSNHHSLTLHGGADGCCQVVVCPGAETSLSETDTELESIPGIELALPSSPLRNLLKQCDQEKEKKKKFFYAVFQYSILFLKFICTDSKVIPTETFALTLQDPSLSK